MLVKVNEMKTLMMVKILFLANPDPDHHHHHLHHLNHDAQVVGNLMMDLRRLEETAAAARRQVEIRRHQEEWMCSAILMMMMVMNTINIRRLCKSFSGPQ